MNFEHQRHKPASPRNEQFELVIAIPKLRSNVNLSRIVRAAGCCGVRRIVLEGNSKIDPKIARDSIEYIDIRRHRTLMPVLPKLKTDGYSLVGLEQATNSTCIHDFQFPRKTALIIGHERLGIEEPVLKMLDEVVEIPVYGRPPSHNVATAACMFLYEFCRQQAFRGDS